MVPAQASRINAVGGWAETNQEGAPRHGTVARTETLRLLSGNATGGMGSIAHRRRFEVQPFGCVFQNCRQLSGNGRFHRALHFSTKSANDGL